MCQWTDSPVWTGLLVFAQVFIFWSLMAIATELENPFGVDANDLPAQRAQQSMNERLVLLLSEHTQITPSLTYDAKQACAESRSLESSSRDGISASTSTTLGSTTA